MNKTRVLCKAQCPICKKIINKKWISGHTALSVGRKHILNEHGRGDIEPIIHKIKYKEGKIVEI